MLAASPFRGSVGDVAAGADAESAGLAEDPRRDPFRGIALHRRRDVGVDLPGDVRTRVVQPLGDDLDVDSLLEGQSCPGVPQAVEDESR